MVGYEEEAELLVNVRQKATDECVFYRPQFYSPLSLYRTCGQHIAYTTVRSDDGRLPCLHSHGCTDLCAQARFRTHEDVEQVVQEQVEIYHAWVQDKRPPIESWLCERERAGECERAESE